MALVEQRMNIKFCVSLGRRAREINEMKKHVYGSDTLSGTQSYEWHRRFREGRESIEDGGSSVCPQTFRMTEKTEKVFEAVRKKRIQTIAQQQNQLGYPKPHVNRSWLRICTCIGCVNTLFLTC
ncbi:hypothetical protein TNCV_1723981 [Trichonephila clavipes]|nr:hypothetical protein TNCV_1723981 [Trichonephila clavipes]